MKNPNEPNLIIKTEEMKGKDFILVRFDGDLDKNGLESVKSEIDASVEKAEKNYLVFDFTNLNFINSESIGYLTTVHYRLMKRQKSLVIIGASAHVLDVLQVIGITQFIKSFATLEEFEKSLTKPA